VLTDTFVDDEHDLLGGRVRCSLHRHRFALRRARDQRGQAEDENVCLGDRVRRLEEEGGAVKTEERREGGTPRPASPDDVRREQPVAAHDESQDQEQRKHRNRLEQRKRDFGQELAPRHR
jgi:hypothetical protein